MTEPLQGAEPEGFTPGQDGPAMEELFPELPGAVRGPSRDWARIVRSALAVAASDRLLEPVAEYEAALAALDAGEIAVTVSTSADYAVAWGQYVEIYDDEEDAAEHVRFYGPDAHVCRRAVTYGQWERVTAAEPPAGRAQVHSPAIAAPGEGSGCGSRATGRLTGSLSRE